MFQSCFVEHSAKLAPLEYDIHETNVRIQLQSTTEYRVKCEEGGNYVEAGRAQKQLGVIRLQEVKRQQKTVQSRHNLERQHVLSAHEKQFRDFDLAWNKYMEGNN